MCSVVPTVVVDGKWSLTCALCNDRSDGVLWCDDLSVVQRGASVALLKALCIATSTRRVVRGIAVIATSSLTGRIELARHSGWRFNLKQGNGSAVQTRIARRFGIMKSASCDCGSTHPAKQKNVDPTAGGGYRRFGFGAKPAGSCWQRRRA